MRNIRIKTLIGTAAAAVLFAIIASCGGGGGGGDAAPAAPAPLPTGTGRGAVIVNTSTMEITGGFTFSGLTGAATMAHIHEAAPGVAGPIIIGLTLSADGTAATVPAGTTVTAAQLSSLQAGNLYFNVHTAANPNGEIRGQITGTSNLVAGTATLNGAAEVPPVTTTATGRGMVVADSTNGTIYIAYVTHNAANDDMAHFHTGAVGVDGPITIGLTVDTAANIATAPVSAAFDAQGRADLNAGNLYYNVHTTAFPGGEIRGQIAVVAPATNVVRSATLSAAAEVPRPIVP